MPILEENTEKYIDIRIPVVEDMVDVDTDRTTLAVGDIIRLKAHNLSEEELEYVSTLLGADDEDLIRSFAVNIVDTACFGADTVLF